MDTHNNKKTELYWQHIEERNTNITRHALELKSTGPQEEVDRKPQDDET